MPVAAFVWLLSTAAVDEAKIAWLVETIEAQSTRLDEQARQIAVQQDELVALRKQVGLSAPMAGGPMGESGMRAAPGRRLSVGTERALWHESIYHKFEEPESPGCGLHSDLHLTTEPLMIKRVDGGNLTMQYSTGVAFTTAAPITLTHHSGCNSQTLALQTAVTIPTLNAAAAGQPANPNNAMLQSVPLAIPPDIIGASDIMGLMLRFAASTNSYVITSRQSPHRCIDLWPTNDAIVHMWDCHGGLNQNWFWMGPYIISSYDPDCTGPSGSPLDGHTDDPRCMMQPYRLLDGGRPLCLTLGDGTVEVTTPGTTCPDQPHWDKQDSAHKSAGNCRKYRTYARPCEIGTGNLFQQWKIEQNQYGKIKSMAFTMDLCLDWAYEDQNNLQSDLLVWDCEAGDSARPAGFCPCSQPTLQWSG